MRAKKPMVMTGSEVKAVLSQSKDTPNVVGLPLYGTGVRLMECLCLRVKDIDFELNQIIIRDGQRDGQGQKDRVTMLPASVKERLRERLKELRPGISSECEKR